MSSHLVPTPCSLQIRVHHCLDKRLEMSHFAKKICCCHARLNKANRGHMQLNWKSVCVCVCVCVNLIKIFEVITFQIDFKNSRPRIRE